MVKSGREREREGEGGEAKGGVGVRKSAYYSDDEDGPRRHLTHHRSVGDERRVYTSWRRADEVAHRNSDGHGNKRKG